MKRKKLMNELDIERDQELRLKQRKTNRWDFIDNFRVSLIADLSKLVGPCLLFCQCLSDCRVFNLFDTL